MHILILIAIVLTARSPLASPLYDRFDASAAVDTCKTVEDTHVSPLTYVLHSPELLLDRGDLLIRVAFQGLSCELENGKPTHKPVDFSQPLTIRLKTRTVILRLEQPELVLVSPAYKVVSRVPLHPEQANRIYELRLPFIWSMHWTTREELEQNGVAPFRFGLALRATPHYATPGGPEKSPGRRMGGEFLLRGEVYNSAEGFGVRLAP